MMPKRSAKLSLQSSVLIAAFCVVAMLALMLTTSVTAQDTATQEPTSEFSLNLPPTIASPTETLDPGMIPSLTGVGGQAVTASVIIRSGPGLVYPQIGSLRQSNWINIVGWNGWTAGRICSPTFKNDLDMWVQVQSGEQRGWIARCVLQIRGQISNLPIVSASGVRTLQR